MYLQFFFFNDTATTEIYTLSLHDALPISSPSTRGRSPATWCRRVRYRRRSFLRSRNTLNVMKSIASRERYSAVRSEEHTSELQSRQYLVCRLLLEKKTDSISAIYGFDNNV